VIFVHPFINASGMLFIDGVEPPLAEEAIRASNAAAGSHARMDGLNYTAPHWSRLKKLLSNLTGAEDLLVTSNLSAAIFLVFHALARGKEISIPRDELFYCNNNLNCVTPSLRALAKQSGAQLRIINEKEGADGGINKSACFITFGAGKNKNPAAEGHIADATDDTGTINDTDTTIATDTINGTGTTSPTDTADATDATYATDAPGAVIAASIAGGHTIAEKPELNGEHDPVTVRVMNFATLLDPALFGFPESWQIQKAVSNYDLVIFSGDKLLGGPPIGIILGKRKHLSLIKKDTLKKMFAADRMNVAALEATLELYSDSFNAMQKIPLLRMLSVQPENLEKRARSLADRLRYSLNGKYEISLAYENVSLTELSFREEKFQSVQVCLSSPKYSAKQISSFLSKGRHPVIPRIKDGKVLLDPRSMLEEEDELLYDSLLAALGGKKAVAAAEEEERDNRVLDAIPSLIWVLDDEGKLIFLNKAGATFWGTEAENLVNSNIRDILNPREAEPLLEARDQVLAGGETVKVEVALQNNSGEFRWLDIVLTPIFNFDEGFNGVLFTASDITERKQNEEKLKYLGMHDSLTGIYNRLYFEEEMKRLDSKRHYPISIVVCDVDGLKLINDIMGHSKGDELLKTAVRIIKKPFRSSDVVARVGGDEFAIILPRTNESVAKEIVGRIQKLVDEYNKNEKTIPLSLSVGYASADYNSGGSGGSTGSGGIKEIFKKADSNMYKNKFERSDEVKKSIIDFLLSLLKDRDFRSEGYEKRLQCMALLLGQAIGIPVKEMDKILLLSRVHDIGKVGINKEIIFKNGELDSSEWDEMKSHPEIGYRIAKFHPEISSVADYILQHHERWDGSGYPKGLKGNNIHIYSRIISIIDAYEAMTSPRPYRPALTHEEAIAELKKNRGIQFDPWLVDIFINLVDVERLIK